MSFAFDIEVATGVGKPDDAASAGAKPDQAVTAQRVNVDPKCEFALYRRPPGRPVRCRIRPSRRLRFSEINWLNAMTPIEMTYKSKTDLPS